MSDLKKYGFAWVTLGLLVVSLVGHRVFGWFAYIDDQQSHQLPVPVSGFVIEMLRDTFENWQSEFPQLLWQVVGPTILLCIGSRQSKESEDRTEEMLKAILRRVDPEGAQKTVNAISRKYPEK